MKKFITYYYLLFVLLILGAFASMAQNDYGNTILGGVALAFTGLFGIQLMASFSAKNQDRNEQLELLSLMLLAGILALRVFYIHFPWVEAAYGLSGLLLMIAQVRKLVSYWKRYIGRNKTAAYLVTIFRTSIILYVFSMTIVPFAPMLTEPSGEAAFSLLIIFVIVAYFKRELMISGEKVSGFQIVSQWKDHSLVLMTLFFLFTAYMGLAKLNAIPKMYSDELPQAYFEFVNRAETRKENPINGQYTHEEFKERYDLFIKRNSTLKSK